MWKVWSRVWEEWSRVRAHRQLLATGEMSAAGPPLQLPLQGLRRSCLALLHLTCKLRKDLYLGNLRQAPLPCRKAAVPCREDLYLHLHLLLYRCPHLRLCKHLYTHLNLHPYLRPYKRLYTHPALPCFWAAPSPAAAPSPWRRGHLSWSTRPLTRLDI